MWHVVPFLGLLHTVSGGAGNASSTQNQTSAGHLVHVAGHESSSQLRQLSSDPVARTEGLSKEMESWCGMIWDHNSEWGGYAVQRFEEAEALAAKMADALREGQAKQTAMFKVVPRDDPLAKMALKQSPEAVKLEEDIMTANSKYLAARAARHQWKVVADAITFVDRTGTITCNQEKDMAAKAIAKAKEIALLQQNGGLHSQKFLMSKQQGDDPNAKEVALEHLEGRKDRLDKMIAWCAAQDAAAEAAKKAKERMVTRTDFQKELHEEAITKIEEKMASFSEMCDSFVDDLKSFHDIAMSEKVSYAQIAESVPQAFQALLDTGHRAWMQWRKDMDKSYDDLKQRCDKLKYIMEMKVVGRQEQIQALPSHEDANQDGFPDVCPTEKELKAERADIAEKIQEVNSWDDAMLDEAQKKAEQESPERALTEKSKKRTTIKKKANTLWR
eukprot:gnl/MRDRNA2_/MRDRNA2_107790_c0_seq1.p1 gnl/MRDRNA2_/MRDRNA2_107790_c0~~gnl/MRDRNA2_/MRDRNA2_107790_c0_seq1.p1  ORF type:complete len:444 (+),score=136.77 gnl/MRDRNA2_/MRDRNA2_107790_c0_seq1:85-1416(+)